MVEDGPQVGEKKLRQMRSGIAMAAMVLAAGCVGGSGPESAPGEATVSGLYRQGFEQSDFYPDAGGGPWWFTYDGDLWSQIEPFMRGQGRGLAAVVRLEVVGEISGPGGFGHLGAYERELIASQIVSVEAASEAEFAAAAEAAAKR